MLQILVLQTAELTTPSKTKPYLGIDAQSYV